MWKMFKPLKMFFSPKKKKKKKKSRKKVRPEFQTNMDLQLWPLCLSSGKGQSSRGSDQLDTGFLSQKWGNAAADL